MQVREFIDHHYRHFNAATVKDAAQAYEAHLAAGGKMFVTLAGAMSTAELGLSLAEMIRQDKVHAITCTGANLEEDVYNLVAHEFYKRVPNYRDLTPQQEEEIRSQHLARVTDTCIPEEEAMRRIDRVLLRHWQSAAPVASKFVHEYLYDMLLGGDLEEHYQIDPRDSWLMAAAQKNLPLFVPGWEDCTLGNACASWLINGQLENKNFLKYGLDYMIELGMAGIAASADHSIGFFQIGGGIAGDFPICVVPMLKLDLRIGDIRPWGYFCQISDSTTSYGSYSGAVPNEKITWNKLTVDTPKFIIESDATIVAPLMFAYLLKW